MSTVDNVVRREHRKHHRPNGTLLRDDDNGAVDDDIDVSYNDDSDSNRNVTNLNAYGFSLNLQINLLSGKIPSRLLTYEDINILSGNLFSCPLRSDRNDVLPRNDPDSDAFRCGSNEIMAVLYSWLTFVAVVILTVIVLVRLSWADVVHALSLIGDVTGRVAAKRFDEMSTAGSRSEESRLLREMYISFVAFARYVLRRTLCLTIAVVVVCMPVYVALKTHYRTYDLQELWEVSALFLDGRQPAIVFFAIMCSIVIVFAITEGDDVGSNATDTTPSPSSSAKETPSSDEAFLSEQARPLSLTSLLSSSVDGNPPQFHSVDLQADSGGRSTSLSRISSRFSKILQFSSSLAAEKRSLWWFAASCFVLLGVLLIINVVYVAALQTSLDVTVTTALMVVVSMSKFAFTSGCLRLADSVRQSKRTVTILVSFLACSHILVPYLIEGLISVNCFYYAIIESSPHVQATVVSPFCTYVVNEGDDKRDNSIISFAGVPIFYLCVPRAQTATYAPSFVYSYDCSSTLITNFAPVFALRYTWSGVIVPVVQFLANHFMATVTEEEIVASWPWWRQELHIFVASMQPYRWRLLQLSRHAAATAGTTTATPPSATTPLEQLMKEPITTLLNHQMIVSVFIQDLMSMLTFGLLFPPLAVLIAWSMCVQIVSEWVFVDALLQAVHDHSLRDLGDSVVESSGHPEDVEAGAERPSISTRRSAHWQWQCTLRRQWLRLLRYEIDCLASRATMLMQASFWTLVVLCLFNASKRLERVYLSGLGLTGELPSTLPSSLLYLGLSHNLLSGTIPDAFFAQSWQSLDVSFNHISGVLQNFSMSTVENDIHREHHQHHRPNGTLLSDDDNGAVDDDIDISYNDDSDFNRNVTNINAYGFSLNLQINLLSGKIPSRLLAYEDINILSGNLFSCPLGSDRNDVLPRNDPDSDAFRCGSNEIMALLYSWLTFVAVVILMVIVLVRLSWADVVHALSLIGDVMGRVAAKRFDEVSTAGSRSEESRLLREMYISFVSFARYALRRTLCLTIGVVVVCMPVYVALKTHYRTYDLQELWEVSALFLDGRQPAIVFFAIMCSIVIVFAITEGGGTGSSATDTTPSPASSAKETPSSDEASLSEQSRPLSLRSLQSSSVDDLPAVSVGRSTSLSRISSRFSKILQFSSALTSEKRSLWWFAASCFALLGILLIVNVAYVAALQTSLDVTVTTVLMVVVSMSKFAFTSGCLRLADSVRESKRAVTILVSFLACSHILVPYLIEGLISVKCFYYAIIESSPQVQATVVSPFCTYVVNEVNEERDRSIITFAGVPIFYLCVPRVQTATYAPSFVYSYDCSSTLITNFAPVFALRYTWSGVIAPVVQYLANHFMATVTDEEIVASWPWWRQTLHDFFASGQPHRWRLLQLSRHAAATAAPSATTPLELLMQEPITTLLNHQMIVSVFIQDLMSMLTFAYVYALQTSLDVTVTTVLMVVVSMSKFAFTSGCLRLADSVRESKRAVTILVSFLACSHILVPYLIEGLISVKCFYYAIIESSPQVQATVVSPFCTYVVNEGDNGNRDNRIISFAGVPIIYLCVPRVQTATYVPSFVYSYDCSSTLITNFAPVFALRYTWSGVIAPVVQYLANHFMATVTEEEIVASWPWWRQKLHDFFASVQPRRWRLLQLSRHISATASVATVASPSAIMPLELLMKEPITTLLNHQMIVSVFIQDLMSMLTFGLLFPPLAVLIAWSMCVQIVSEWVFVDALLQAVHDHPLRDLSDSVVGSSSGPEDVEAGAERPSIKVKYVKFSESETVPGLTEAPTH
eukprot:gene1243-906_t